MHISLLTAPSKEILWDRESGKEIAGEEETHLKETQIMHHILQMCLLHLCFLYILLDSWCLIKKKKRLDK